MLLNIPLGAVTDTHGRVATAAAGEALAALGMLGTGFATNVTGLLPCRLMVGAGAAASEAGTVAYLADLTEQPQLRPHRGVIIGLKSSCGAAAWCAGPAIGGFLGSAFGAPAAFFTVGAIQGAVALLYRTLPEPSPAVVGSTEPVAEEEEEEPEPSSSAASSSSAGSVTAAAFDAAAAADDGAAVHPPPSPPRPLRGLAVDAAATRFGDAVGDTELVEETWNYEEWRQYEPHSPSIAGTGYKLRYQPEGDGGSPEGKEGAGGGQTQVETQPTTGGAAAATAAMATATTATAATAAEPGMWQSWQSIEIGPSQTRVLASSLVLHANYAAMTLVLPLRAVEIWPASPAELGIMFSAIAGMGKPQPPLR